MVISYGGSWMSSTSHSLVPKTNALQCEVTFSRRQFASRRRNHPAWNYCFIPHSSRYLR